MKTAFGNIRGGFTALLFSSLLAACEGGWVINANNADSS